MDAYPAYKKSLSFIHASDLHLGAQQFTNPPLALDYISALTQILSKAESLKVDFLLLGGDVFTSRDLLPSIFQEIVILLQNFYIRTKKRIKIIAIEGNHDIRRYSHGQRLEQKGSWLQVLHQLNLVILLEINRNNFHEEGFQPYDPFKKSGSFIRCKEAIIYGSSFHKTGIEDFLKTCQNFIPSIKDTQNFHVLLQHFGIAGQMKNVPGVNFSHVLPLKQNIHYLGLGHYHKGYSLGGWIFNPGCPEAVSPIEVFFSRGLFYVEVFKSPTGFIKNVEQISIQNRKYEWLTVISSNTYKNEYRFQEFVQKQLEIQLREKNYDDSHQWNPLHAPRLFVILRGVKPKQYSKRMEKRLRLKLQNNLNASEVRIYPKFDIVKESLDKYFTLKSVGLSLK